MTTKTKSNSDVQFARENSSLIDTADQVVRNVFLSLSVTTNEKPNDILRAVRISLRRFAAGDSAV